MKRNLFYWHIVIAFFFAICFISSPGGATGGKRIEVLTSTFPIHQITQNVTHGRDNMNVSLMLPAQLGCPHDYVLTPQDMQKLAKADILIINGLGMEEFIGAPLAKANYQLKIIDSSSGIKNVIKYAEIQEHKNGHHETAHKGKHHEEHAHKGEDKYDNGHHNHAGVNPHLFASPRMAALLAKNIANELAKIDPAGSKLYFSNAQAYAEKMNKLAEDFSAMGKKLRNNRIVTQHGVLDYLARDTGLKVVAVVQPHAGQEPSASEMLEIIETAKHKKAGAIFTEPQYPEKIGRTIGKEAGIATATLDPVATGPENAPLNYYETIMRKNLAILEKTLGTR